ncbi:hypothetical protein H6G06_07065 [Anabaena sphaerica FACHB-251]|uniref:TonB C-terminal domain-containing protein n=1 Tax=Anabaena sphaerica FACHB-251 TaxID=2692883 RepID=A0A926WET9_9NOST|nr:hypothetical protein [Anabaena sphaerica]MBD2293250.1 hypothetical protein [Anabaena sphaerica FACHB-251]
MSYVSLLKNVPEILSQPTGIAAIASLGIHGAIALIVPLMPVDSSKSPQTDSTKAVGLMELSSADQNRLPQTADTSQVALQQPLLPLQPQIPLPNFGNEPAIIPPLEPALPSQQVLPPIPTSSANYNSPYLPRRQPTQRYTKNDFRTQVSNYRLRSTFSPTASPFVDDIDAKIRETQPLNINRLPQVQADNKLPAEPLINPSPDAIDIGSTTAPQGVTEPQKIQLGDSPVQIAANSPSDLPAELSVQGKGQLLSAAPIVLPSPETSAQPQGEVPTFSQADSQGKKSEQLLANLNSYNTLRKTIREEYPNVKEQAVIRETISTNKRDMEGTVLGRLVVDPDGKVVDIKFQDRSVAPELQSKTREFFNANPPKAEKRISSYPFQLRFKNNSDNNIPQKTQELKPSQNPNAQKVSEPQERKNQPNNQAVIIPNSSATPLVSEDKPTFSTESAQKLIKQLRQVKEERQDSNQEK